MNTEKMYKCVWIKQRGESREATFDIFLAQPSLSGSPSTYSYFFAQQKPFANFLGKFHTLITDVVRDWDF